MNLPNKLTLSRIALTLVFVVITSSAWRFANTAALIVFAAASFTDWLDGHLARKHQWITDFGKLMDPLADKMMMAAALICLVPGRGAAPGFALPAWVVVAIVSREFAITGLRLLAANKGVVLPAEKLGKHKTVWQIVLVCYFFLMLALSEWTQTREIVTSWNAPFKAGAVCMVVVSLWFTVYSGAGYIWKNRELISTK